ncbi:zinc ribbon domain-containing protein [Pectinatus frisingensis]|uniref:zinc ribbon domain-containing protein n=1 Tax=Pectinatus frisingensis TaxID=865 RepID=UPI0018C6E079|nr:zinc ribbon domain-containing protein [Pectinatus frisingensis]
MRYADFHIAECPICTNEIIDKDAHFCKICGTFLENRCTDESCKKIADNNARYCTLCGSKTLYYQEHLLKDWQEEKMETEERVRRQERSQELQLDQDFGSEFPPDTEIPF